MMIGAIYRTFQGPIEIESLDIPKISDNDVLIRVKATGICRSDWHGWMGHDKDISLPHVPGHEFAGIVAEKGRNVKSVQVGERVTVPFVCACGQCRQCNNGNHQICDHQSQPGFTHWGSFAEYTLVKNADVNLVPIPDDISFETAASLGCRFATSFRALVDQAKLIEGQWLAIHGCGGVGLSAIMIAKAYDARIIAIDVQDGALEKAKKLGAEITLNSRESDQNIADQIIEHSGGGVNISMDALGDPDLIFNSISSLAKRGKHIQVGLLPPLSINASIPTDLIIAKELEIIGSHGMQAFRYEALLDLIKKRKLNLEELVVERMSLQDVCQFLPNMDQFHQSGIHVINSFS